MRVVRNFLLPMSGYKAMTVGPLILVRPGTALTRRDVTHEAIHWEQQKEMLVVGFMAWYAVEFLVRLCQKRSWHAAYRAVSLEREAYAHEDEKDYPVWREPFAFLHYVGNVKMQEC